MAFQDFKKAAYAAKSFQKPGFKKFGGDEEGGEETPKFGGGFGGGEKPEFKKPFGGEGKEEEKKEMEGEDEEGEEKVIDQLVEKFDTLKDLIEASDDEAMKTAIGDMQGLIDQLEHEEK